MTATPSERSRAIAAQEEITDVLKTYERSLNGSDATLAARCYTRDGVFMPTTLPTAMGAAVHEAYTQTFETIRLNVEFTIDELVVASDAVAYALTRSNGAQTVLATGEETAESNREVFIFAVEDGAWKIKPLPVQQAALIACGRSTLMAALLARARSRAGCGR